MDNSCSTMWKLLRRCFSDIVRAVPKCNSVYITQNSQPVIFITKTDSGVVAMHCITGSLLKFTKMRFLCQAGQRDCHAYRLINGAWVGHTSIIICPSTSVSRRYNNVLLLPSSERVEMYFCCNITFFPCCVSLAMAVVAPGLHVSHLSREYVCSTGDIYYEIHALASE